HAVERPRAVLGGGVGAGGGAGDGDEVGGQVVDLVAVAHPDGRFARQALDERVILHDRQLGPAIFAGGGGFDLAAEDLGPDLHAVADAQDRHVQLENAGIAPGGVGLVDAAGAPGED